MTLHTRATDQYSDNAQFWIHIIRQDLDRYRTELTTAAMLNAVGQCRGVKILDAGCGEGYLSRMMAEKGAGVVGLDLNTSLIAAAREAAKDTGIQVGHDVASVEELPYKDGSFDVVVANHLLNDLPDLDTPMSEFARVLKPGGRFVALFLHPCFYLPRSERMEPGGVNPAKYFEQRSVHQQFVVSGLQSPAPVTLWFRPMEDYFTALQASGFVVQSLQEPHPPEAIRDDPWWQENFRRPMFMLISAAKA